MAWTKAARDAAALSKALHAKGKTVESVVPRAPKVFQVKAGWSKSLPNNYQLTSKPLAVKNPISSSIIRKNRMSIKSINDGYGGRVIMPFSMGSKVTKHSPPVRKYMEPSKPKSKRK